MRIEPSAFDDITGVILAGAIEVHRTLGPGLLESIYLPCLHFELASRNLRFVTQRRIPVVYKGAPLDTCYFIDLIVEDLVVVEAKSVAALLPVHQAQTLTYLRLTGCPVGLLINFNVPRLMDGVKRLLNPKANRSRGRNGNRGDEGNGLTRRNEETEQ
jgi:GxxExxY protein